MSEKVLGIIRLPLELLCFLPDRVIAIPCPKKWWEKEFLEYGLAQWEIDSLCLVIPYSEITKIGLKKKGGFWGSSVEFEMITTKKIPVERTVAPHKKWGVPLERLRDFQGGVYSYKGPAKGLIFDIEGQYKEKKKKAKIEDYENMLRPIFRDKLSVNK